MALALLPGAPSENWPSVIEHTTGPLTFWGWPPMVTFGSPRAAAGVLLGDVAELELVAALDVAELEDGPEALLLLEQPATPATIVAAATAINSSGFTDFRCGRCRVYGCVVICCVYR
ncbi:MAG TPA: hypothetical protein VLZ05_19285 [Mycobacterium sp.]|nr:hypothetical protein [Mycobacterium sp.]